MGNTVELSDAKRILLRRMLAGDGAAVMEPVTPRRPGEIPPISPDQMNVWVHAALAPELPLYNESITIHRHGAFDLHAIEASFNEILLRHESWRSSFAMINGRPRQIVHRQLRFRVPLIDLTHLDAPHREREARRIAETEARKPFDLARAPLLRATAVKLADGEHRIYLTLHHIIFDGVSIYRVVVPELTALYDAFASGRKPDLARPKLQYGDYACWRERQLGGRAMARDVAYWRDTLAGDLPVPQLPSDRQRPALSSHRGGMEVFSLSPRLTSALKELSRREGATLYATLLAAFKALLHRYSGQDDILIGGVADMRRRPELENLVGYFLNCVPLRTRPAPELTFRAYLAQVQHAVLGALDARAVPFDRIVRELQPKRDADRRPLFDVLFSIEPPAPAFAPGWDLTQMDVSVETAKFDLYLELDEREGGFSARFLYSADLFDAPRIRRMADHWINLLEGAVADPDCALGSLPLLTPAETQKLLIAWNRTEHRVPAATLDEWFAAQARETPNRVAVQFGDRQWTYRDLDRRAERLAQRLRQAGVGPETLVGIAMERSLEMVAGLLAIHKAGGAYLPLDPALPPTRLALLIEDAQPPVLLTSRGVLRALPRTAARIVLFEAPSEEAKDHCDTGQSAPGADRLAYVLYTSGSSGRPKAVEVTQRSLVNLLAAMQREPGFNARDRLLAVTTLSFDIAALELFLPLVSGGRVIVASREDAADPKRLAGLLARSRCTVMQATPATWRLLLEFGWSGQEGLKILCGGEPLARDLADRLLGCSAGVWNMYGPTETTIWSTLARVTREAAPVPIGRPIANTRLYVLDGRGNPVPAGIPGELHIGGTGLARGYRNDPVLTCAKFVTGTALKDERLYRTGDIVQYREDGALDYLGRTDNQVKIRGHRVGIEEVEAALAAYPGIGRVAVKAWPDTSGELALAAYLVGEDVMSRVADLRRFLRDRLPDYMIPSRYVALAEFPLTANEKLDRKRLPRPSPAAVGEAPQSGDALERQLAQIWKNLLGLPTIGIHENFFDLGGHSLLAFLMIGELQKLTGRELPLGVLIRHSTIADLARLLRSNEPPPFSHLVPLKTQGTGRRLFMTHAIFGNVLHLRDLSALIETERPIYALQARGADPQQEPHDSIAEMAEAYIEAIRQVQPAGPYALAGYSFGGLIAYEMAARLREEGETVDFLALIDVDLHARNLPIAAWLRHQWMLAQRVGRKLAVLPLRQWPGYLARKAEMVGHRALLRIGRGKIGDASNDMTGQLSPRQQRMYEIGLREFIAFKPRYYSGRLTIFHALERGFEGCDPLPAWRRLAAAVDTHPIAAEHDTILSGLHLQTLADQLSRCLVETEANPPPRAADREPEEIQCAGWLSPGLALEGVEIGAALATCQSLEDR